MLRAVVIPLATAVVLMHGWAQTFQGAPAQVIVSGHVADEAGKPVPGAEVQLTSPLVKERVPVLTNASGAFSIAVPPVSRVAIVASHPEFGRQFTGGFDAAGASWDVYRYIGPVPTGPIELRLRRGVVLRGRVVDPAGRPFANDAIFLVPPYVGSGPVRIEAATDSEGRFEFDRMVLNKFELVPHGLDFWRPRVAGDYLRIAQVPEAWLAAAMADRPIELRLHLYTLVPVTLDVSGLRTPSVQVWTRGPDTTGSALEVDARGRVQILMEVGIERELWVVPGTGRNMVAPWTRGIPSRWIGTPSGPLTLRIGG